MKRTSFLLFALVAAFFMSIPVQANNVLTVFDDEEYGYSPIETPYIDEAGTRTQTIYPAEDLAVMTNDVINALTFYTSEPINVEGGVINVLVGETTKTGFMGNDYEEGLTQVATISMVTGTTEMTITFDTPYFYHGGNFIIETYVAEATECCFIPFIGFRPTNYTTITRGEVSRFLPKTTFNYGTNNDYSAKIVPYEVTFNTIRAEREDVQSVTLTNNGQNAFIASFSATAPFVVDMEDIELAADSSLEIPVIFAPAQPGEYHGTLTLDCGQAGILTATLNGTAIEAGIDMTICDSTEYASFVPIYGADIDIVTTQGQMIYPAEMLTDMAGGKILALQFHVKDKVEMNGGTIQLSLKIVDGIEFTQTTMATELTAVATASPVFGGTDLTFNFNEPYTYNGGNLLVDCLVTEAGVTNYKQTFFYGTPTDYNAGIYKSRWYGNIFDIEFVPFLPKVTFTYQKPTLIRGDVNHDGFVNISDVLLLINYLLNDASLAPAEADCNYDHAVNISDALTLINYVSTNNWPN